MFGVCSAMSAAVLGPVFRCWLFLFLAAELRTVHYAGALEIYAPNQLFVENGTFAKLPCTFKSTEVTSSTTSITWTYTEESGGTGEVIFYYIGGMQFPGQQLRFKNRITWAGDINNSDVSIKIDKITFKDHGTYTCNVLNPQDLSSTPKQIKLRVVEKEHSAGGLEVYAPDELFIEDGTEATLPCAFRSSEETSNATTAIWMYSKEGSCSDGIVIFYFIGGRQYPGGQPHFKDRVSWAGDINTRDVSIKIDRMSPEDDGSYSCMVINPPELTASPKLIKLRVARKETYSRKKERK